MLNRVTVAAAASGTAQLFSVKLSSWVEYRALRTVCGVYERAFCQSQSMKVNRVVRKMSVIIATWYMRLFRLTLHASGLAKGLEHLVHITYTVLQRIAVQRDRSYTFHGTLLSLDGYTLAV